MSTEDSASLSLTKNSTSGAGDSAHPLGDRTPKRAAAGRFARANMASITRDQSIEAWRLEVWDGGALALGLWSITDLDDLDEASYESVRTLLANVGLVDEGREGWAKVEESWMSPVHAVE